MKTKTALITSAITGLLAFGAMTMNAQAADEHADKDKCYGVAKAGKNDCASGAHSCAGQSKTDNNTKDWSYVPKGTCEKMGGSMMAK
jgi:uncharacterized membrane protein